LSMLAEASCEDNDLICSADELAFLIEETKYLWEIVDEAKNMPFSVFEKEELAAYQLLKNEVSKNMKLVEAEKYSSYKNLQPAIDKTSKSFMKLLTLFGDFDSVQTFYAKNLQQ